MKHRTLAALVLGFATPAHAQDVCAPLIEALETLHAEYGEQARVSGLGADGRLFVITAAENGTWTMLIVDPGLTACLVTHGEALAIEAAGSDS